MTRRQTASLLGWALEAGDPGRIASRAAMLERALTGEGLDPGAVEARGWATGREAFHDLLAACVVVPLAKVSGAVEG